jgi:serine/threonine protein kinase
MPYAVKRCSRVACPEFERRKTYLLREVSMLASLCHPNIVRLVDAYADANSINVVLDRAADGTLFDRLARTSGPTPLFLSETEARKVFRQLFDALKYLVSSPRARNICRLTDELPLSTPVVSSIET